LPGTYSLLVGTLVTLLMMNLHERYVISPPPRTTIAVVGTPRLFPARRVWCVGRNYLEHIREMGQDERAPPFFFAKPVDALTSDGAIIPYPPLTHDLHFEVELVVAIKGGGHNLAPAHGRDLIYGYAVGIDLTRRDLQSAAREAKRPWEIGKAFDLSAPCSAIRPAAVIGHPSTGRICLSVNGVIRQDGNLEQLIWTVPEIIAELSAQVALAPGDVIFTGTPAGVGPTVPGDRLEAEVSGVGTLKVTIGPRA
jgi:fumarylpyruvate hydrolase